MDRYPPIAEHGLIGDLQTAALVTTDGSVDWFCCPRFDSPSVFASLLDRERGGYFRIAPEGDDYVTRQLYFPDTAILITRFMTPGGVGEVIDFMPVEDPDQATDRHRLVRAVRCVRGEMRFVVDCAPRFDYGRQSHDLEVTEQGAVFRTPAFSSPCTGRPAWNVDGDDVRGHHDPAGRAGGRGDAGVGRPGSTARAGRPRNCWPCSPTPPDSGAAGWPARPTVAAGGRWSPARPSRSS